MAMHSFNFLPGKQMVRCMNFSKVCREALEVAAAQAATSHFPPLDELGCQKGSFLFGPAARAHQGQAEPQERSL